MAWDGNRLRYFEHEERRFNPALRVLPRLVAEWLMHWTLTRPKHYLLVLRYLVSKLRGGSRDAV